MQQIIDILLENFDISYMLSINILTYIVIKFIDYANGKAKVKLITKRLVLILCTIVCCILYSLLTDINIQKLINSYSRQIGSKHHLLQKIYLITKT